MTSRTTLMTSISLISLLMTPNAQALANSGNPTPPAVVRTIPSASLERFLPATPAYSRTALVQNVTALSHLRHSTPVSVVVDSPSKISALMRYAQAVNSPGNPLFHRFLSPRALLGRFGPGPTLTAQADQSLIKAGWRIMGHKGLITEALVPPATAHPGIPVSTSIWSLSGLVPHRLVPNGSGAAPPTQAGGYPLASAPRLFSRTVASNGDVLTLMSWNPGIQSGLPAGLPLNVVASATSPSGTPLAITRLSSFGDLFKNLGFYGARKLPNSSGSVWDIPIAAIRSQSAPDVFQATATLGDGTTIQGSLTLPSFTGNTNILTPVTASQIHRFGGFASPVPKNPGPGIAIFTIGQLPNQADLNNELSQNGLPNPTVTYHYQDGSTASQWGPEPNYQEAEEDIQAVSAADPGAHISEYVYPANDSQDALLGFLNTLAQQSSDKIATISYGFYGENKSSLQALIAACTAEGITIVESSGDSGSWVPSGSASQVGVSDLVQIPGVLTVGGVDAAAPATRDSTGGTHITGTPIYKSWGGTFLSGIPSPLAESLMSRNRASSGGYGTLPIPSWQAPFLPSGAPGIGVPDIASLAGEPGFLTIIGGKPAVVGGTSLAAPLTAGWLARVEGRLGSAGLGNINPLLYKTATTSPSLFTQPLYGSNGLYHITTTPGSWNPVTGLGVVNWNQFEAVLAGGSVKSSGTTIQDPTQNPVVGQPLSITANNTTLSHPFYQFWVKNPRMGQWSGVQGYSPQNTYRFTPSVPGTWLIQAYAKEGNQGQPVASPVLRLTVQSSQPMVAGLTVSASATNSVATGQTVTYIAQATDPSGTPLYQFWLRGPQGIWHIAQGYGPNARFVLHPDIPGTYEVFAYALDQRQVAAQAYSQAYGVQHIINVNSALKLSAPPSSPVNQSVTVTATPVNVSQPLYQYWVENPAGQWASSAGWTPDATYSFQPTSAGIWKIQAYAKGFGSGPSVASTVETVAAGTQSSPPAGLIVDSSAQGWVPLGQSIRYQGYANLAKEYQFWVHGPTNRWRIAQGYGTQSTFTLTPAQPGSYVVVAYALTSEELAKNQYSLAQSVWNVVNVNSTVSLSGPSSAAVGQTVILAADATNITNPVYQYWVENPAGQWAPATGYTHGHQLTYTPKTPGTYVIHVYAKDPYAPSTASYAVMASVRLTVHS